MPGIRSGDKINMQIKSTTTLINIANKYASKRPIDVWCTKRNRQRAWEKMASALKFAVFLSWLVPRLLIIFSIPKEWHFLLYPVELARFYNCFFRLPFQSRLPIYISHTPAGTSTQDVIHFAQVISGRNSTGLGSWPNSQQRRYPLARGAVAYRVTGRIFKLAP